MTFFVSAADPLSTTLLKYDTLSLIADNCLPVHYCIPLLNKHLA
jgi:hypothetical protein